MSDAELPPISVYGGVGGERAVTEDLERGAAVLHRAAQELREAGKALRVAGWNAEDAYPRALPEVAPFVYDAKESAWDALQGTNGATALERELEDVGSRLNQVAVTFLAAEREAHGGINAASSAWRSVGDLAAAWAWWGRTSTGTVARHFGQDTLAEFIDPEYALPTTGVLNRTTVEHHLGALQAAGVFTPLRLALLAAARIAETLLGEERLIDVESRQVEVETPITSLGDLGDVLAELNETSPREVTIDRIVDADGNVSWMIVIPGTGDFVSADGEVIDGVSDLENLDGSMSDATDLVLAAMAEAGIGPDEPVLLAGHSAGGMIASALASSKACPYSVKAVVTVGSPVAAIPHTPGVSSLHIENEPDLVPALDGRPNPDLPHVVTARFDSRTFADPAVAAGSRTVMGAHDPAVYAQGMRLIETQSSASVKAWREETQPFFSHASTVERTVVSQVHGPAPQPPASISEPRSEPTFEVPRISLGGIPELRP